MKYKVTLRNTQGETYRAYVYAPDAETAILYAKTFAHVEGAGASVWVFIKADQP